MHVRMSSQPCVIILVYAGIVQDDMDFFVIGNISRDVIHELNKLDLSLPFCCFGVNGAGSHLQGSEEVQYAMSFVSALQSPYDLAA